MRPVWAVMNKETDSVIFSHMKRTTAHCISRFRYLACLLSMAVTPLSLAGGANEPTGHDTEVPVKEFAERKRVDTAVTCKRLKVVLRDYAVHVADTRARTPLSGHLHTHRMLNPRNGLGAPLLT